jgi:uroporphyrinogen-III decarboxylase
MDYEAHNEEVRRVWEAYRAGKPTRVPFILGINPRYTMFGHAANPRAIEFERYMADPQLMIERQVEHAHWIRHNLPHDVEMGLPERWTVYPDYQNVYEAAWFGCEIRFHEGQVPDTQPILHDDAKRMLFDRGIPDPFEAPAMKRAWEIYDFMKRREEEGWTYKGRPIQAGGPPGGGTDGPMTVACNLRGACEFCTDLLDDPEYAVELLDYVTEAAITRIKAYRQRMGLDVRPQGFGYADDSIALLSTSMVEELILPRHRRMIDELSQGGPNSIHLCGNATRHFPLLKENLGIMSFDTGFPVDFAWLRTTLGPEVEILGGPSIPFLETSTPEEIREESRRILNSGIMNGGRFILREGNNLSPAVGPDKVAAMYAAAKLWG